MFSKTLFQGITRPYNRLISENISKSYKWKAKTLGNFQNTSLTLGLNFHLIYTVNRRKLQNLTVNRKTGKNYPPTVKALLFLTHKQLNHDMAADIIS